MGRNPNPSGRDSIVGDKQTFVRILAGEIQRPGTFSVRTLRGLGMLNHDTASLFRRAVSVSIRLVSSNRGGGPGHGRDVRIPACDPLGVSLGVTPVLQRPAEPNTRPLAAREGLLSGSITIPNVRATRTQSSTRSRQCRQSTYHAAQRHRGEPPTPTVLTAPCFLGAYLDCVTRLPPRAPFGIGAPLWHLPKHKIRATRRTRRFRIFPTSKHVRHQPECSWNQTDTNRGVTVTGAGSSGDEAGER